MAKTTVNLTDTVTNWVTKTNQISGTIGDLVNLNTTQDSDIVGAINELKTKTDIGWGHQIRSYVLQPYQLVKDLRNKTESTNPTSVLAGNIDQFIEEGIKNK